jgi:dipeptidyl aminopeptidase/acylaminoacyl peptidase
MWNETLKKDIRPTAVYREATALFHAIHAPGTGQISDALEINASPTGSRVVFSAVMLDRLEGAPATRIAQTDLDTGHTQVLTFGPGTDRLPKYSPDGTRIAFLSDRAKTGDFQLFLLDAGTGRVRATPPVDGWVEYLHWSSNGRQILLGVAGYGADVSGGQGATSSQQLGQSEPTWMPSVDTGDETFRWRGVWIYDLETNTARKVDAPAVNVWEAVWCGNDSLAAIVSSGPTEGSWYTARFCVIDVRSGTVEERFRPRDQLAWPRASPSGNRLVAVEALCSDRLIAAGELRRMESGSSDVRTVDTHGVDIAYTEWTSERMLLLAGHRGFETVVGLYDWERDTFREVWSSTEITTAGRHASVSGFGDEGDFVLVGEGYTRSPEVAVVRSGTYVCVKSFDVGYADEARVISKVERVTWTARDGLDIQGWLLLPAGTKPFPLILFCHGGPVWHWRPMWLGRTGPLAPVLMLLRRGFAVLFPNPRGSAGRGQAFVRPVLGDMGGADAQDCLAGIDHLVACDVVDRRRLGVIGQSYGGFMTSWLISQDSRFAAAVSIAPVTNHVTQHLVSNIPEFVALFLQDRYSNAGGKYYERSPVMHAHKVKTPTLNICGTLDRCTPPEDAMQFHNALRENGVRSVLVTYPEEGHGIRKFPAALDYSARAVGWFDEHIHDS